MQGLCNGRASVRLSVPSIDSNKSTTAADGFAAEHPAGMRYLLIVAGDGAQQQMWAASLRATEEAQYRLVSMLLRNNKFQYGFLHCYVL